MLYKILIHSMQVVHVELIAFWVTNKGVKGRLDVEVRPSEALPHLTSAAWIT